MCWIAEFNSILPYLWRDCMLWDCPLSFVLHCRLHREIKVDMTNTKDPQERKTRASSPLIKGLVTRKSPHKAGMARWETKQPIKRSHNKDHNQPSNDIQYRATASNTEMHMMHSAECSLTIYLYLAFSLFISLYIYILYIYIYIFMYILGYVCLHTYMYIHSCK